MKLMRFIGYLNNLQNKIARHSLTNSVTATFQIKDEGYEVSINFLTDAFNRSWNLRSIDDHRIVKSNLSAENYYSDGIGNGRITNENWNPNLGH